MNDDVSLDEAPEALRELPASSKLTYVVLLEIEPATHADLVEATTMPERTVRDSLRRLDENGLIDAEPRLSDPRQSLYTVEK